MSVNDQDTLPARSYVDGVFPDVDVSISAQETGHKFVVISGDINYTGPLAGLAQDFLDDVVVLLWPINSAAQGPDVDEVSYHIKRLEIILPQKIQQRRCIAAARAQVSI